MIYVRITKTKGHFSSHKTVLGGSLMTTSENSILGQWIKLFRTNQFPKKKTTTQFYALGTLPKLDVVLQHRLENVLNLTNLIFIQIVCIFLLKPKMQI